MNLEAEFSSTSGKTACDQDVNAFAAPDLSAQEFAEHTANQTASAFQATGMFEVVEVKAGVGQVHLLGRVKRDFDKAFTDGVITPVLKAIEETEGCEGHLCKQFLRKNGATKFAWTISFAANDLRAAAHAVVAAIEPLIPKIEVMESPLRGPGTPVGAQGKTGRKGATPVRG
jgi:hypothetical protein